MLPAFTFCFVIIPDFKNNIYFNIFGTPYQSFYHDLCYKNSYVDFSLH